MVHLVSICLTANSQVERKFLEKEWVSSIPQTPLRRLLSNGETVRSPARDTDGSSFFVFIYEMFMIYSATKIWSGFVAPEDDVSCCASRDSVSFIQAGRERGNEINASGWKCSAYMLLRRDGNA